MDERFFTDPKGERATGCNCKDKSANQKDLMPIAAQKAGEMFPIAIDDTINYISRWG